MLKKNKRGQSTLEYIILVTAVIVIVISLVVSNNSPFRQTLNSSFNTAIQKVGDVADSWDCSI